MKNLDKWLAENCMELNNKSFARYFANFALVLNKLIIRYLLFAYYFLSHNGYFITP